VTDKNDPGLPRLADIFDKLRLGWHLCSLDGELYWLLDGQRDAYTRLFEQLGFRLEKHQRDFYYFSDTRNFTTTSQRMALFVFVLVESVADQGKPIEETLMTRVFRYDELPHLQSDRYRSVMKEAETGTEEELVALVRSLERFGFAERVDDASFRFRPPAYRFLDLCYEILKEGTTQ
jgi:hypothetical protein